MKAKPQAKVARERESKTTRHGQRTQRKPWKSLESSCSFARLGSARLVSAPRTVRAPTANSARLGLLAFHPSAVTAHMRREGKTVRRVKLNALQTQQFLPLSLSRNPLFVFIVKWPPRSTLQGRNSTQRTCSFVTPAPNKPLVRASVSRVRFRSFCARDPRGGGTNSPTAHSVGARRVVYKFLTQSTVEGRAEQAKERATATTK